jgi:spore germination protein KA
MDYIKARFNALTNKDIVVREFIIAVKYKAFIAYMDGMIDRNLVNNYILRPLLSDEKFREKMKHAS